MAEAVDRLELVADEEELGLGRTQEVHDVRLQAIGVLELVHQDRAEPRLLTLTQRGLHAEEVAGLELEILEVECRLAGLRLGVLLGEEGEQLLQ